MSKTMKKLLFGTLLGLWCGFAFGQNLPDNIDSANCTIPSIGNDWGIQVGWSSTSIVCDFNIPLVGDLDDDGNPEIVCFSNDGQTSYDPRKANKVLIFDGVTKQLKTTLSLPTYVTAYDAAAYGLIKTSSRKGLIVIACYDFKLRAYDITSANPNTPYWVSNEDYGADNGDWAVNVSFADFNNDGHLEVFVRNKIYNAETGVLLATTTGNNTSSSYCHFTHVTHWKMSTSIAANLYNDSRPELILGNEIYDVNITNPNGTSGNSITLVSQITPPSGVPIDGNAQVADFNSDGYLDVFISVRDTDGHYGNVYCYVWDVHNNTVSTTLTINTSFSGKSIPMIADIDNDELLEVLIQCGVANTNQKFQTYKYHPDTQTFSYMWGVTTDEDSYSNSITSFDFNQDGLLELMISDQATVRIVNGSGYSHITGNDTIPVYVMNSFPFSAVTIMQYPIIADVDNDGNAEIVSVGSDKLNIFESSTSPWAPTRKVWNQYMYNVTNINNDLTVPQYIFNNATPFTDPDGVIRRPFNNFLQQATTIDQYGRPFYAVPDVAALSANITPTSGGNATLNVTYTNQGDNNLNAPYYITVFANQIGGAVVQTLAVNTSLPVGETGQESITLPTSALCQLENVTTLIVAINCNGGGIAQDGNLQPECDITNNTAQVTINLQSEPTNITETACDQFVWNETTYSQSGQYEQTLSNSYGCDSLVILSLTIHYSDTIDYNVSACENYTWNEQTYSQSGQYQQTLQDSYGCDSIVIMNLTIVSNSDPSYFSDTACYQYQWNDISYSQSGQYQQFFQNSHGCDSIVTLNLTIGTGTDYSIHGKSTIFPFTDITSGQYAYFIDSTGINPFNVHWDIDREDWTLIPHGASCDLVCTSEGQAVLRAWTEGELCDVDTTMALNATFYSIGENEMQSAIVYPNPTNGSVTVIWQDLVAIKVFNLLGQKVGEYKFEKQDRFELDLRGCQEAVYVLEITSSQARVYRHVVLTR